MRGICSLEATLPFLILVAVITADALLLLVLLEQLFAFAVYLNGPSSFVIVLPVRCLRTLHGPRYPWRSVISLPLVTIPISFPLRCVICAMVEPLSPPFISAPAVWSGSCRLYVLVFLLVYRSSVAALSCLLISTHQVQPNGVLQESVVCTQRYTYVGCILVSVAAQHADFEVETVECSGCMVDLNVITRLSWRGIGLGHAMVG